MFFVDGHLSLCEVRNVSCNHSSKSVIMNFLLLSSLLGWHCNSTRKVNPVCKLQLNEYMPVNKICDRNCGEGKNIYYK